MGLFRQRDARLRARSQGNVVQNACAAQSEFDEIAALLADAGHRWSGLGHECSVQPPGRNGRAAPNLPFVGSLRTGGASPILESVWHGRTDRLHQFFGEITGVRFGVMAVHLYP